ncbi:MAG: histidine kinase [Bacteroidota bacterium]
MTVSSPYLLEQIHLEERLKDQGDAKQRIVLIDKLTAFYVFVNIPRAIELLDEFEGALETHYHADLELNFHLYKALAENQQYDFETALYHYELAINILKERGTIDQQAEGYIDVAGTYMNVGDHDAAIVTLDKASKLLRNFPDDRLEARITCRWGFYYLHYADYPKAIELFLEAEKKLSQLGKPLSLKDYYFFTLIYSGLGKVYEHNDQQEKSVKSYLRVVEMCERFDMRSRISWHYLNVGVGYMALGNLEEAEQYLTKAIDATDDESQYARASAYANLGYCSVEQKDYEEALELLQRAELTYQSISKEDFGNFCTIESWRGRIFQELGKDEKALLHLEKALVYAQQNEDFKQLAGVCKSLAQFYAADEQYKKAYEYQLHFDKCMELHNEQANRQMQVELEVKYEAAKKQQQAELLSLKATQLQLKALRAQMNPHFMYNALNSIQNYITSNETASAAKYLAKFATLMRQSLEHSDLEFISLEQEIQFLENYLFINEKLRYQDRMRYKITVSDDIEEDIIGVPTMIVQPYVENAIEHGLRTKKDGLIKVDFQLLDEEDTVLCIVEDNGIGRVKAKELQLQDPQFQNHRSRGTSITENRLEILHPSKEGEFVKTIDLYEELSGNALGTRVEVKIPIVDINLLR